MLYNTTPAFRSTVQTVYILNAKYMKYSESKSKFKQLKCTLDLYTQTKVKQHHIFSETLFWKLQNGIYGKWK